MPLMRNAAAWQRITAQTLVLFGLCTVLPACADPCEDVIKMDGLFTQARRDCPFSYYAFRFQQESQLCMEKKGPEQSKKLFSMGQSTFTDKARTMGKEAICQKLLADFPMTVRR